MTVNTRRIAYFTRCHPPYSIDESQSILNPLIVGITKPIILTIKSKK